VAKVALLLGLATPGAHLLILDEPNSASTSTAARRHRAINAIQARILVARPLSDRGLATGCGS
jgi:hypothetical protein